VVEINLHHVVFSAQALSLEVAVPDVLLEERPEELLVDAYLLAITNYAELFEENALGLRAQYFLEFYVKTERVYESCRTES
jgi:hypothetical protein